MKENWKIVVLSVAATLVIALSCFVNFKNNDKKVKLEFMTYDASEKKDTLDKTVIVKKNEVVDLGNNKTIKVLEIKKENIKISRDVVKYKIINEEERKAEPYTENITETVKYGDTISIDIDEQDPFGPIYEQSRYHSYIKVIKG